MIWAVKGFAETFAWENFSLTCVNLTSAYFAFECPALEDALSGRFRETHSRQSFVGRLLIIGAYSEKKVKWDSKYFGGVFLLESE